MQIITINYTINLMNRILSLIYSTRTLAVLFLVFAGAMGVATFIENDHGTETAKALIYNAWWFELIMLLFVINFLGNVFKYRLYRKEKWVVLLFHLSFILILFGAGITRYISFEGIMPIKEGQVSNSFYSQDSYVSVIIDNGKEQLKVMDKKILFSALGKNNVSVSGDFRGTPYDISLVNYIPNALSEFRPSETGKKHLQFVESGSGGRHDHYIEAGSVQEVHGVSVGLDTEEPSTISFATVNGSLKIKSMVAGSFYRMSDQYNGTVLKDSLQDCSYLSVYNVAGLQFVIPKPPVQGEFVKIRGDKDENPLALLEFEVKTPTASEILEIKGGPLSIQPTTRHRVGDLNFTISYGSKMLQLPFNIQLNDFQLENYPGSQSAMSYASEVTVIDPNERFDFRIYMNNILNYKGYKFFQSSYNITPQYEETHLSVNHDFWGSTITYIGYFMLYLGLVLILFMKKTRFDFLRKTLVKLRRKKLIALLLVGLSSTIGSYSQTHKHDMSADEVEITIHRQKVAEIHAEKFSKLVIQDMGGRMKPVHTYASELLRKVSKHDNFKGMNATQVFLGIQQNPSLWAQVPIIYLEKGNTQIREMLGVDENEKYVPFRLFFDENNQYILYEEQQKAQKKNIKSKFEKDVINIDRRVNLFFSALRGDVLRIFPIPNDPKNTWVSQQGIAAANFKGQDSLYLNKVIPLYYASLQNATQSADYSQADEILDGISNFQKTYGASVYPSDKKITMEIAYNKYDIFKKLFSYYMYIGTLMFLFVIVQIFRNSKLINLLVKLSIAIILGLFALHTMGLIARWIVSEHAPWSNAYESMIYVAWATMLFGLIFGRRSSMTIAATAFLTSFILMVAHWNWMDPEIANLVPVLNSYWLMIHVAIIVASYGPFALGMILGLISLLLIILTTKSNKKKLGNTIKELTVINEMALTVGLVLLTIGNFLGGMWANESWGRYWGWDPKETWALISIMIYAFVLHVRLIPGLKGRFVFNVLSIVSFASILMTYFGVNFYLSGLHSYASGDKAITPTFVYYAVSVVTLISILAYFKFKKHYKK